MNIIEYEDKYLENIRDLLVELEEYIIFIDKDNLDTISEEYREKYVIHDLEYIKNNAGKCYLAIENDCVVGLIMGAIPVYEKYDYLDYKCPKRGIITELIVTKKVRNSGIGKLLMSRIENYFKSQNCEYVLIDVFAYNENAIKFYAKEGYHHRMFTDIKKLK